MKINNQPTVTTADPLVEPNYLDVKSVPALVYIPENTIKLIITAKIMDNNDAIHEAYMTMNVAEVAEARIYGEEWENENRRYVLTDKGKELGLL